MAAPDRKIPAYVDRTRLCEELDIAPRTLDDWLARRGFPKPKKPGSQYPRWKWAEVERYMDGDEASAVASGGQRDQAEEIKNASKNYARH